MNSGCCVRVGVISLGGAQGRVLRPAAATQQRVVVYTASFEFQPCLSKCDTTAQENNDSFYSGRHIIYLQNCNDRWTVYLGCLPRKLHNIVFFFLADMRFVLITNMHSMIRLFCKKIGVVILYFRIPTMFIKKRQENMFATKTKYFLWLMQCSYHKYAFFIKSNE